MKILFITLSNIGDCFLSLPALDSLLAVYPKAEVTVMCGRRCAGIFEGNFYIKRCIIYERKISFLRRLGFLFELRNGRYDLVVDLRNSAIPLFLKAKYKTYPWVNAPRKIAHRSNRHLYKVEPFIRPLAIKAKFVPTEPGSRLFAGNKPDELLFKKSLCISDQDRRSADNLLNEVNISRSDKFILVSPGARSHIKRWPEDKFAELNNRLIQDFKVKVLIVGDEGDFSVCAAVQAKIPSGALNICAKTSLKSLAGLMEKASLIISNDSAVMHLASYLDRPVLAVFGPTDYQKYGPWGRSFEVVHSRLECSPCEIAQCSLGSLKCMEDINVDEVYAAAKKLL